MRALTLVIFTLIAIPSRLTVGPLGSAGTPAQLIGLGLFAWWLVATASAADGKHHPSQPVKIAMFIFVLTVLASDVVANARPAQAVEIRSAEVGILSICGWLGILLTAADAIPTRERLDVLLRRLALAGGALATLGVVQFITKQPYTNYIRIPGLTNNAALVSVYSREGFARPAGTALHPIEFGAALTMCLPIALHYAINDTGRGYVRRWYPVLAIAVAVPISISRSAILSTVVVLVFMFPIWSPQIRHRMAAAIIGLSGILFVVVPGLLGTLAKLFTGFSGDSDTQSRTGSFSLAWHFIARSPIFGRGFSTFLPQYRIIDDAYLGALIEIGFLGFAAVLALFATGVYDGFLIRARSSIERDRALAIALAAAIASFAASSALFDAFGFPMASGIVFLLLGCISALHRLSGAGEPRPVP